MSKILIRIHRILRGNLKCRLIRIVQQICDENQTKGSVSDKSTNISRKVAEMILFEISYEPKLNKSKMAVISKMAAKFKKKSQNYIVIIKK